MSFPRGCYCAGDGDCCYCERCYHEWTWCKCDCKGCRAHELAGEAEAAVVTTDSSAFLNKNPKSEILKSFSFEMTNEELTQCTEVQARGFPHDHGKLLQGVFGKMIDEADRDGGGEINEESSRAS